MFGYFLNIQSLFQNHKTEKVNWNFYFKKVISSLLGHYVLNVIRILAKLKVQTDFCLPTDFRLNQPRLSVIPNYQWYHMVTYNSLPTLDTGSAHREH